VGLLAAGFGVSRATAYRYRDEATCVLAATAPVGCRSAHGKPGRRSHPHHPPTGVLSTTGRATTCAAACRFAVACPNDRCRRPGAHGDRIDAKAAGLRPNAAPTSSMRWTYHDDASVSAGMARREQRSRSFRVVISDGVLPRVQGPLHAGPWAGR
jgi:hypothetical protein